MNWQLHIPTMCGRCIAPDADIHRWAHSVQISLSIHLLYRQIPALRRWQVPLLLPKAGIPFRYRPTDCRCSLILSWEHCRDRVLLSPSSLWRSSRSLILRWCQGSRNRLSGCCLSTFWKDWIKRKAERDCSIRHPNLQSPRILVLYGRRYCHFRGDHSFSYTTIILLVISMRAKIDIIFGVAKFCDNILNKKTTTVACCGPF